MENVDLKSFKTAEASSLFASFGSTKSGVKTPEEDDEDITGVEVFGNGESKFPDKFLGEEGAELIST